MFLLDPLLRKYRMLFALAGINVQWFKSDWCVHEHRALVLRTVVSKMYRPSPVLNHTERHWREHHNGSSTRLCRVLDNQTQRTWVWANLHWNYEITENSYFVLGSKARQRIWDGEINTTKYFFSYRQNISLYFVFCQNSKAIRFYSLWRNEVYFASTQQLKEAYLLTALKQDLTIQRHALYERHTETV